MKIIRNDKLIRRNARIGGIATLGGLALLIGGNGIHLYHTRSFPGRLELAAADRRLYHLAGRSLLWRPVRTQPSPG